MMSSILAPASRFSKMTDTGIRVPFNTHAPLTLPGMSRDNQDGTRDNQDGKFLRGLFSEVLAPM